MLGGSANTRQSKEAAANVRFPPKPAPFDPLKTSVTQVGCRHDAFLRSGLSYRHNVADIR